MHIKSAALEDAVVLQTLASQTYHESFKHDIGEGILTRYIEEHFSLGKLANELQDPNCKYFLGKLDSTPVAYAKLNIHKAPIHGLSGTTVELERLYVLNTFQKSSFGTILLQHCVEEVARLDYNIIWLAVWEKNTKAIGFYSKFSFKIFGSKEYVRGGKSFTGLLLKKLLAG